MGFRFHAWRANHGSYSELSHATPPPAKHIEPMPGLEDQFTEKGGDGRRVGFPDSMFQRDEKKSTVITDGGWVRPSPAGWSLPPEQPIEHGATKNPYAAAGNNRRLPGTTSAGGGTKLGWGSGPSLPMKTIDSTETAKKYGGRFMF